MDSGGAEISDIIEAPDSESAQAQLREQGYFVTKLKEVPSVRQAEATLTTKQEKTTARFPIFYGWLTATLFLGFVGAVLGFMCGMFIAVNAAIIAELVFGRGTRTCSSSIRITHTPAASDAVRSMAGRAAVIADVGRC